MAKYIDIDDALSIIEEKQKELCPPGLWGRHYVCGHDREAYDEWEKIIDEMKSIPAADVEPVRHGQWKRLMDAGMFGKQRYGCCICRCKSDTPSKYCPNCGANMGQEEEKWATTLAFAIP